ncbi:MAG: methenyltetrahydromethanopterin cyclohydrolase [Gemmatales bacterium]|nr:methenyltetrahydromethanopterin cyclohydrolase [Gemmatales bacterium]MDW8387816.1 methenyltetrahydromethanopterin cyclohydrolase [Gemmatales bacterium]
MADIKLNDKAKRIADHLAALGGSLRIEVKHLANGTRILDCGVVSEGGLQAGIGLAKLCTSGLAEIELVPGKLGDIEWPFVQVHTDWPVAACMASQYAGWQISVGKYFAMGSGPMRAAYGKEELFDRIGYREHASHVIGVLESRKLPSEEVSEYLAGKLDLEPSQITLAVAPASSLAGTVQVVARSVETALHKLHDLGFDLGQVVSGYGTAPLPPTAADEVEAIGRTNDAILYGGHVVLWVRSSDERLKEIGPRVPSCSSSDYGAPFSAIFERYHRDFYKMDPHLFSPAAVTFVNLTTGRRHRFGATDHGILMHSFGS